MYCNGESDWRTTRRLLEENIPTGGEVGTQTTRCPGGWGEVHTEGWSAGLRGHREAQCPGVSAAARGFHAQVTGSVQHHEG